MLGVFDEEIAGSVLVTRLGPNQNRFTNRARLRLLISISVGGIKAAREATQELEVWLCLGSLDNFLALPCEARESIQNRSIV